jgi:hypothetical protein
MASNLKDYLAYYIECESPGYAVLITGEWGTGKTFQVKQALAEEERYYVSLYGLQTVDEVHSAVLAEMDPALAKVREIVDGIGNTAKDAGGLLSLGAIVPKITNAIVRKEVKADRILIFDDLERSGLDLDDRLGVINLYVEHHGCRVVAIAHDEILVDGFQRTKEKLFGHTIKIKPQVNEAFSEFCSSLQESEKLEFLETHRAEIIGLFISSRVNSLRILRHTLQDLGRLHDILENDHLKNSAAMTELVGLFSALNMEVRAGNLSEDDLRNRSESSYEYEFQRHSQPNGEVEKPKLVVAGEKYATIDLRNNLLQDSLLIQMLIEGRYIQERIRESLNSSPHFIKIQEASPWTLVINFDELEDEIVEDALSKMLKQFEDREVSDPGEMLHIFSLRLMLTEREGENGDILDVANDCKKYINDLLSKNRLPPMKADLHLENDLATSHYGYQYWVTDATREQFTDIKNHLSASMEQAMKNQFPEITPELIKFVKTDGKAFLQQVCFTNSGDNPYAQIPILSHIPAEEFVTAWLGSPKENWRGVARALQKRYETDGLNRELSSEKEWVRQVVGLLEGEANKADGFKALRIERIIPGSLRNLD